MQKFFVTWEKNGQKLSGPFSAESRDAAEKYVSERMPGSENVYARTMASVLDERIRQHIQAIKLGDGITARRDSAYEGAVKERLRACADAAYMFGEASQESLDRTLGRMVDCGWEITGLDGHMFSFGFRAPNAGFSGGIIFHCSCKEWSSHT